MNKFIIYISVILFFSCTTKFSRVQKSKDNEYKVKMAEQYFASKKYTYAQQLFEEIFPYIKGTERYEDSYYKFAYCYFYDHDYNNAENLFKTFSETFPNSKLTDECDYMRAYCYYLQSPKVDLDQTNTRKSMSLMQAFINGHPNSKKLNEASEIIDKCREKLELKEYSAAKLYYDLGQYKASAISFATVAENYPDSKSFDLYKLNQIQSLIKYADLSIESKQEERYQKVIIECNDFSERFNESKYLEEIKKIKVQASNYIKKLKS